MKREPFQLMKLSDLSLTFSRDKSFDYMFALTKTLVNNVENWVKFKRLSGDVDDWNDFTDNINEYNLSSSKGIQSDDSAPEEGGQAERVLNDQAKPSKSAYLKGQTSLLKAIHKNSGLVDGGRKCRIPTCPLRHKPGSGY